MRLLGSKSCARFPPLIPLPHYVDNNTIVMSKNNNNKLLKHLFLVIFSFFLVVCSLLILFCWFLNFVHLRSCEWGEKKHTNKTEKHVCEEAYQSDPSCEPPPPPGVSISHPIKSKTSLLLVGNVRLRSPTCCFFLLYLRLFNQCDFF